MFEQISKWLLRTWNVFSVISIDRNKFQLFYSTLLMVSCVYIILFTPQLVCSLEGNCDNSFLSLIKGMFAMIVAVVGMISRFVLIIKGNAMLAKYKRNVDDFHACTPITRSEAICLNRFSSLVLLCSLLLIVPLNTYRLWLLWNTAKNTVVWFTLMYIVNFSMCCIETHFIVLCFVLYQKFVGINSDLMAIKINTFARNKYPFPLFQTRQAGKRGKSRDNGGTVKYNEDVLHSLATGTPVCDFVKKLKSKHTLGREAVKNLNNVFGVHLTLSLCSLCMYVMFDLYYYILELWNPYNSMTIVFGWILQYILRFVVITTVAHVTTKQVIFWATYTRVQYGGTRRTLPFVTGNKTDCFSTKKR